MKTNYDSLIFDLDGTLWYALHSSTLGWNQALKSLEIKDLTLTEEDLKRVTGNPYEVCAKTLIPEIYFKKHPTLIEKLIEFERKVIETEGGRLYEGVSQGLEKLSKIYNLFIVSNCETWYLNSFFNLNNIKRYFKDYTCFAMNKLPKKDNIAFLIKKHDLKNPIYIGDTEWDEEASKHCKIDFTFVTYGYGKAKNPKFNFKSFIELTDFFLTNKNA